MTSKPEDDDDDYGSTLPLKPLSFDDSFKANRINYPREWEELMMPDKADIAKEHMKFGWRKGLFYIYFSLLLVFIHQFPSRLEVVSLKFCIVHRDLCFVVF